MKDGICNRRINFVFAAFATQESNQNMSYAKITVSKSTMYDISSDNEEGNKREDSLALEKDPKLLTKCNFYAMKELRMHAFANIDLETQSRNWY